MEKNGLKIRISRLFQSSFNSCCRSKNINTDVFEQPANHYQHRQLIQIFSPKHFSPPNFPSINNSSSTDDDDDDDNINSSSSFTNYYKHDFFPRRKICCDQRQRGGGEEKDLLIVPDVDCQFCPPHAAKDKVKKRSKKRSKRVRSRSFWIQEYPASNYNGLFSSDEDSSEQQEGNSNTTLFSSDSSELLLRRNKHRRRSRSKKTGRKKKSLRLPVDELLAEEEEGKKKKLESGGGFAAVVKRSKDPYSDFMNSMVEMIMEEQIFGGEDLEKLLQSFLSLNSDHHHRIIIQVFKEIWEALFANL